MRYIKVTLLLFTLLTSLTAYGFKISPMSFSFNPQKNETKKYITISNDSDTPKAIQLSTTSRIMNENGKEIQNEVDGVFLIFPEQFILKPRENRRVLVHLSNSTVPEKELAYRIIAEQLPINLGNTNTKKKSRSSNIQILLRYVTAVYILPSKPKVSYKISSTFLKKMIRIKIENTGTRHFLLNKLNITYQADKKMANFSNNSLKGMAGENILTGSSRIFLIKRPINLAKDTKINVIFNP